MNNVNMSDIASKIHFIYKDECEKNIAAMVIFHNNGKYFFDEKHENEMTNDEVEALLLRGALVYKDDEYVNPSSFNNGNVSFGVKNAISLGNYIIQFNKDEDTLDFLYNGVIDEPILGEITLAWVVGNLDSSGAEIVQDSTLRTDFVAIEDNYDYSFYLNTSMADPGGIRVYFYDADKEYISRTDGDVLLYTTGTDISIDIPTNAAYMRFKTNVDGTTTINNINSLFTLRKRKTAIVNNYVTNGLSLYIDADDVATYGSVRDITGKQNIDNHGVSTTLDNGCLNFVASESDYLDCGFVPNLSTWSTEIYAYFTSTPTDTANLYCWGNSSSNRIRVGYSRSDKAMTILANTTKQKIGDVFLTLQHLVVTANNGTYTVYINGVQQYTFSSGTLSSNTNNMVIGTSSYETDAFADMNLKIFRHYDGKVLSAEEVLQNYNYETNRNESIIAVTWIDNKKLDSSTGELVEGANNNACTEFIAYDSSYNYTLAIDTVAFFRVYYYDSSQSYISNDSIADNFNGVITPPKNTVYMRLKLGKNTVEFTDLDNHVIFKRVLK